MSKLALEQLAQLERLQQRFQQAVLVPDITPGLFVREDAQREGGFDLYQFAYRARLAAALRDNFPVLHRALGDEGFEHLAQAYIEANPSRFRSIRWFGDALLDFLAADLAGEAKLLPHPALFDLASLDWAMRGAFDAAARTPLVISELASLAAEAWADQRFMLQPSVRIVELSWQVEPIWHALNEDAEALTDAPQAHAHALLVWRPLLDSQWRSLSVLELEALRAVQRGENFAQCCESLSMLLSEADELKPAVCAAQFLQQWVAEGLLVSLDQSLLDGTLND